MKLIKEMKLPVDFSENDLVNEICKKAKINSKVIKKYEILKMGLDARKKPDIF